MGEKEDLCSAAATQGPPCTRKSCIMGAKLLWTARTWFQKMETQK